MNKNILYFQIVILLLVGCTRFKYEFTVIPTINYSAREAERISILYAPSNNRHLYIECVKNALTPYIKKEIINRSDHISLMIIDYSFNYITTSEKASPYNYHNFIKFIKSGGEYDDGVYERNKELITQALQYWTSVLYDTCGQYAYTVDERCAALSAVDLTPDWCTTHSN